jgi:hypothetical protein
VKPTQYQRILAALRKAGRNGCTNHDLMVYSNCPWKRIDEMEYRYFYDADLSNYVSGQIGDKERIIRDRKQVNGRWVRVYRLERV